MSRKEKKSKSPDEPGLGSVLAVGAAVAGVAAVAYGAWKLFDFLNSAQEEGATGGSEELEKKKCIDSDSDNEARDVSSPNQTQLTRSELRSGNGISNTPSAATTSNGVTSLHDRLMSYYSNYVDISPADLKEAQTVVKALKVLVSRQLNAMMKLTAAEISDLMEYGNAADGINVICPEEFEILIPLKLEKKDWGIQEIKGNMQGCVSVVLKNMSLPVEICDANGKVTPISLKGLFRGAVERAIRSCRSYEIDVSIVGASLVLSVKYADRQKMLEIIFQPAIIIGDDLLVPSVRSNSKIIHSGDEVYLWKRSYLYEEQKSMERFSSAISSHRIVLKIFFAVSLNWPSLFGTLNAYHYKTILLRLLNEQPEELDWTDSTLPEHFIDFLIELGCCLKDHNLPHYFESSVNLFEGISTESLQKLADFVNKLVGQQDFADLLKCEYQGGKPTPNFNLVPA